MILLLGRRRLVPEEHAGDDEEHDVYVAYSVDGKEYNALSDTYSSSYFEGKEITIFYNPDNPAQIHGDSKLLGIILMAIAVKMFTENFAKLW